VVSGAEFRLLDMARELPRYGVSPVVACDGASPLAARLRALHVDIVPMVFPSIQSNGTPREMASNLWGLAATAARVAGAARTLGVDWLHVNTLLPRLPAVLAGRLARRRVLWHIRDVVVQPAWQRLYRAVAHAVDRIVTVSHICRQEFPGHPRLTTIYNGLDLGRYHGDRTASRRWLGVGDETIAIGMAGLLSAWKGHEVFLQAAAHLVTRCSPPLAFVIAGGHDGDRSRRAEVARRADALGLAGRVRLVGFCEDMSLLLSALDVVVVPSLRPDPLPGIVLEAMALARPVVASRIGGIPEMVDDGITGLLVDPGDAEALAAALARLVEAPERRRDMGRAGRAVVEQRFRLDQCVRELRAVYETP
jgi:glycosyltransferase involved in cell wall biosynthesis